jgi:ABC-2 type transport system ATP-binding protein
VKTIEACKLEKTYKGGIRALDGLSFAVDEPTTGLDPEARAELWREIERLAGEEELTILLTTHYLEEADRLASELVIVDRGRIVAQGGPDELKSELRGDTVQVELADSANGNAAAAVSRVPGVSELVVDGRLLRARAADGAAAIPSLITALEQNGLTVASAAIARPSLDDVYLRHAGRSFPQADTDKDEPKEVAA